MILGDNDSNLDCRNATTENQKDQFEIRICYEKYQRSQLKIDWILVLYIQILVTSWFFDKIFKLKTSAERGKYSCGNIIL